ncbi:Calcium-binding mitochondrial carrier protein SCaMC-3 [Schistosoma japonicum]|nr:Calcium-binding mitochondrial carrier protein SCaMC-3 [Schistosoma japonicum]KAH8868361.1 Calcium-binding mitochondrial carrier protein SCaMC-3 [Schistosoma japonicum]KAH8868362.1 Calcium-binding mitochondrial carrier protein SCaMC-3 [Schistosoma japonicum]KAH8868363.1 Calcium-binding mitochondrial carrier protein SCaMC-3 [Schistosoma japonicum]KAH8868364.1 Calcium-binding mitochondrial carrier protein SCaMC-3 [Schistosoma japonicum]
MRTIDVSVRSTAEPLLSPNVAGFVCGGISGTVSRTVTAPMDRLKVLRQMDTPEIAGKDMIASLRILIKEGGILSLWRGNGVNILKNCPESAIRFGLHGWLKSVIFPNVKGPLSPKDRLLVASLAGATSLTITYPVEILKTRMALRRSHETNSILSVIRILYTEGSLRGFYRGYKISMMSYVPYSGMELCLYEMLKQRYVEYHYSLQPNTDRTIKVHMPAMVTVPLILISCCIPMIITYPANLLRTRYQASSSPYAAPIIKSMCSIVQKNGFKGLYRGLSASLSKTVPSVCVTYLVFESTSELLGVPGLGCK